MSTIKRFHLNVDAADLPQGMGVGTGTRRDPKGAPQLLRSPIEFGLRSAVEDLDDVDPVRDPLDRRFLKVAPARVVRVFEIYQSALTFDRVDGLFW
jgi:hypothetical protein